GGARRRGSAGRSCRSTTRSSWRPRGRSWESLLAGAAAERAAGAGVVKSAGAGRDLETERRRLGVEERDSLDAGERCADESAVLGLVRGKQSLGLHRVRRRAGGLRLPDEWALFGARRLRSSRAELRREHDAGEHEADDERDDSEAAASHLLVIGESGRVLEPQISQN